jgi:hypothetical protein
MTQQSTLSDSDWIIKVRRALRDLPAIQFENKPADAKTGGYVAGAAPFRLSHQPIVSGSVLLTAPGGAPGWTVDYNDTVLPPAANHVNVNTDTGELVFSSAPPAPGTVAVSYQSTRFTDDQILDALYEGMNNLYPHVWNPKTDTTTLSIISPIQYEYGLDIIFGDERTIILDVEYSPPDGIIQYFRTSMWRQTMDIQNPKLIFTDLPPIASTVRLTYTKSFQSLGEVPSQVVHLCKYYALAFLMGVQEAMRTRADDVTQQTTESASPAGSSIQTAAWWLQQFQAQLDQFSQNEPARATVMNRVVERLHLSRFWTDAA